MTRLAPTTPNEAIDLTYGGINYMYPTFLRYIAIIKNQVWHRDGVKEGRLAGEAFCFLAS